jgi:pimeloyl-ACP methyl ester carboxylesterase
VWVDLVQLTTADAVRLEGMLQPAVGHSPSPAAIDAALFVHGTGGCFYTSTLFDQLAMQLTARGVPVLRVNTRGHDLVSTAVVRGGGKRQGAAYEVFDDCRLDLEAWTGFLAGLGYSRILLAGHSSGALKAVYAAVYAKLTGIAALLAISPPRLSYAAFSASSQGNDFQQTLARAREFVSAGLGGELLDVKFPLPFLVTAESYLEKYGPEDRYNLVQFVAQVEFPLLFTFGSEEMLSHPAFRRVPDEIRAAARADQALEIAVVAGADHFYTGRRDELAQAVENWLGRLPAGDARPPIP